MFANRTTSLAKTLAARSKPAFKPSQSAALHISIGGDKDVPSTEVEKPGFAERFGLNDWKIVAPISCAMAIPALENHIYVLNEESQLACCFFLFVTASYKYGGEAIGEFFDEQSKAIMEEQRKMEDENIAKVEEAIEAHKAQLNIAEDIEVVRAAYTESVKVMCDTATHELKHQMRDVFVKNLEGVHQMEMDMNQQLQDQMVAHAYEKVSAEVNDAKSNIKKSAFDHAVAVLGGKSGEKKEDEIVALFSKHLKAFGEAVDAQKGQSVEFTADEVKELQGELNSYMKRFDLEGVDLKAPTSAKLDM